MKTNLILLAISSILISSCSQFKNPLDKHIAEFNDCIEKKKSEKSYKYSNIQEALNSYDFEVARDYLACHPDKDHYYDNGKKTSDVQYADKSPYDEDLRQIVTAEVTYFVAHGELKKAETTAKEANMLELYEKLSLESFESKLDELVENKDYSAIYNFLSTNRGVVQKTPYDLSQECTYEYGKTPNKEYNKIVREFNALLDKILVKYKYLKVDKEEIKSVLDLALPELVNKNDKDESLGSKFSEVYKKEATAKYLK